MSLSNKVKSFFQAVMKPSPTVVAQAAQAFKVRSPHLQKRSTPTGSVARLASHTRKNVPKPSLLHLLFRKSSRKSGAMKPHVPLIRFRKGSPGTSHGVSHGAFMSAPSSPSPARGVAPSSFTSPSFPGTPSRSMKPNETLQLPVIEDWQLPSRFQRRPLDDDEIAVINRGGPEKF